MRELSYEDEIQHPDCVYQMRQDIIELLGEHLHHVVWPYRLGDRWVAAPTPERSATKNHMNAITERTTFGELWTLYRGIRMRKVRTAMA
jgi:hypothetical protein